MPRKRKEKKFDEKLFLSALEQLGSAKGISSDVIVEAISDSFKIAFTKKLEDEDRIFYNSKKVKDNKKLVTNKTLKLDDALVRCDIDLKLGKIDLYHQFKVVNDDDIEDDFIEIGLTEAQKIDKNLKVGDFYEVPKMPGRDPGGKPLLLPVRGKSASKPPDQGPGQWSGKCLPASQPHMGGGENRGVQAGGRWQKAAGHPV